MSERIAAMARSLCGAEEGDVLLEGLCRAAESAWRYRLKEGVSVEDCEEVFVCAAAMTAAADYQDSGDVASFTAGELSVKRSGDGSAVLRRTAERLMRAYAEEDGFAFRRVKG